MSKLKVLISGQDPGNPGGVAKCVGGLLDYLGTVPDIEVDFFNETRVKGRRKMLSANKLTALAEFLHAATEFKSRLLRFHPDIVHLHVSHGNSVLEKSYFATLCNKAGVPVIMHLHASNLEADLHSMKGFRRALFGKALARPNHVIVLAERLQNSLVSAFPDVQSSVVTNSVMLQQHPLIADESEMVIGFIGHMDGRKGELDLLHAAACCDNKNIKFVFAGDGNGLSKAKALTQELEISGRVQFLGVVDGVTKDEFFKRINILALPSYNEGLPISLLEAMAYGRPVIATPVGGIPELIADGVQGWLVAPGDIRQLAAVIDRISCRTEDLMSVGRNGWETVARDHSWEVNGSRIVSLYRLMTDQNTGPQLRGEHVSAFDGS